MLDIGGILLALAIGFLVGIERGWRSRDEEPGGRVAGIRTFTLLGLLGGFLGIGLKGDLGLLFLLLAAGAVAALIAGYVVDMLRDDNVSATSALAAVATMALGAFSTSDQMVLASVGAGLMVVLLASREALHRAIQYTSADDLRALLRLVLVVFVILPLLPDQDMGPYGALNPRRIWMVVVITGSISFVGYVLARLVGERRGPLVTALVGSLVSSTAVTVDSARRIREGSGGAPDHAAVAIASAIMLGRSLLLVAALAPYVLASVAMLVGPALVVSLCLAALFVYPLWQSEEGGAAPRSKPPGLGLALLFAATVAVLALGSAWAQARLGGEAGALVIAIGGTADIDAAIAAVGALPYGSLPTQSLSLALAVPVLFNTLFKLGLLGIIGGWRQAGRGVMALAGTSIALLIPIGISLF